MAGPERTLAVPAPLGFIVLRGHLAKQGDGLLPESGLGVLEESLLGLDGEAVVVAEQGDFFVIDQLEDGKAASIDELKHETRHFDAVTCDHGVEFRVRGCEQEGMDELGPVHGPTLIRAVKSRFAPAAPANRVALDGNLATGDDGFRPQDLERGTGRHEDAMRVHDLIMQVLGEKIVSYLVHVQVDELSRRIGERACHLLALGLTHFPNLIHSLERLADRFKGVGDPDEVWLVRIPFVGIR